MNQRLLRGVRSRLLTLVLTATFLGGPLVGTASAITLDQVVQMHKSGLPPQVIIQTLQSTGTTFKLSVSDVKRLKKTGVPQNVIDVMTSGGGGAAPAPEPAPEPAAGGEVDELERMRRLEDTERERIEEDARIREAARRAADKERKRMEAEERRRVAAALDAARDSLQDGEYARAANLFDQFLKTAPAGRPSTLEAKLGMADALYGLRLYGNAAELYHELLNAGAESRVFTPAFKGLRRCAKRIAYNPVTLESLTNHYVGGQKQPFQDSYNYFLGKFFFDYNRYPEARKYLDEVNSKGADYADGQYLLGLIQVAEAGDDQDDPAWPGRILGASQYFQKAVVAGLNRGEDRVAHLAYLALARIAYSVNLYKVAIYYYRKVPYDSTNYVNSLHESGWSYFLSGDRARGMGIFHTLDGPDWKNSFLPDMHLLEATVFMNTCHFKDAHAALKRITDRFLSLKAPLTRFISTHASPEDLYKAFVLKQSQKGANLPKVIRSAVITNSEFFDLYTTVTQYRREVARINASGAALGDDLVGRLLATVETRRQEGAIALGIKINQILQAVGDELDTLEIQKTEVQIEIDSAEAENLEKSIEEEYRGPSEVTAAAAAQATATIFVGDQYVNWPFEGEFWADEINSYRSDIKEICKR